MTSGELKVATNLLAGAKDGKCLLTSISNRLWIIASPTPFPPSADSVVAFMYESKVIAIVSGLSSGSWNATIVELGGKAKGEFLERSSESDTC